MAVCRNDRLGVLSFRLVHRAAARPTGLFLVGLGLVCLLFAATGGGAAAGAEKKPSSAGVLVETFQPAGAGDWTVVTGPETQGLQWPAAGEKPGLRFLGRAVPGYNIKGQGTDLACRDWPIGTRPFHLTVNAEIDRALQQQWFRNGVAVAVASAKPGEMGKEDYAIVLAIQAAGATASVHQGGVFALNEKGGFVYRNLARNLIRRGGGNIHSRSWNQKRIKNLTLKQQVTRDANGLLSFAFYLGQHKDPWWQGTFQLPEKVAKVPLKYLLVKRIPIGSDHMARQYGGLDVRGRITEIQAYPLDVPGPPVLTGYSADSAVLGEGARLRLEGRHLGKVAEVTVAGRKAKILDKSADTLGIQLPKLPAGPQKLVAIGGNGLRGRLETPLPVGRFLERILPSEALPAGGQVVTVRGGGFEEGSEIRFAGRLGRVVELLGPAAVRVEVPAGKVGRAEVTAVTGTASFVGSPPFGYAPHPYIMTTAEQLPKLKAKFHAKAFADYATLFKRFDNDPRTLGWLYHFTGEKRYLDALIAKMRKEAEKTNHEEFRLHGAIWMALAYDLVFAELPADLRADTEDYLMRVVDSYTSAVDSGAWWYASWANPSNTIAVGGAGGGLAGLALMHSRPKAAACAQKAGRAVKKFYRSISPDGGCVEGTLYWNYGFTPNLLLGHALKNATGDDHGLLDTPAIRNNLQFVEASIGGNGRLIPFNDTQAWLTGIAICADLGSRFDQPLMRWMADTMAAKFAAANDETVMLRENCAAYVVVPAFLWRDEKPAPESFPGVPVAMGLDVLNWGVLRSSGDSFVPGMVVGLKGLGGTKTHHTQADQGSIVAHANGEAYLIDPGYFNNAPVDHTRPLIGGKAPRSRHDAPLSQIASRGPWRTGTIDSTKAYAGAAKRARRVVVLLGEVAAVLVDDVIPAAKDANVTALYQCGWAATAGEDKRSCTIAGRKGQMRVQTFGPELELAIEDRQFAKSWGWRILAEKGQVDWHTAKGTYRPDPARPLVTVLLPAAGKAATVGRAQCTFADGRIAVTLPGGQGVAFKKTATGWVAEPPK